MTLGKNILKNFLQPLDSKSTAKMVKKQLFSPKSRPGACLAVCLIFWPISAWRAYKLHAYKKKCVCKIERWRWVDKCRWIRSEIDR